MDPTNLDENDPKSVARLMKKMGEEMGEDTSEMEDMMAAPSERGEKSDQTDSL